MLNSLEDDNTILQRPDRLRVGNDKVLWRLSKAAHEVACAVEQMEYVFVAGIR